LSETAAHCRLATYNIHTCVGRDGLYHPERILDVLGELNADVIALQEVAAHPRPDGMFDQFDYFQKGTGFFAIPGHSIIEGRRLYGNALLSRFPVESSRHLDISVPPYERRGAIQASLAVNGIGLHVVATHLGLRLRERRRQIRKIADALPADLRLPAVIMGDFNYWGPVARWAFRSLAAPGLGHRSPMSFPSSFPLLALDRIRARGDCRLLSLSAHRSALARKASDHLPVIADLELRGKAEEEEGTAEGYLSSSLV
jgi:endonuclease/exonuclease/phosphatase family metal-dependent hydrolase